MTSPELQQKAREKVEAKKGVFIHLGVFVITSMFFLAINVLTKGESGVYWFQFPVLAWSIGVAIHYFVVMGIPGSDIFSTTWEEREYEKELEILEWQEYQKSRMQLPDGIDKDGLDLTEMPKALKQKSDEQDFV